MADSGYRVEMITGVPVVAAPAVIDVTTTDELRRVLFDSAAGGHATVVVDMTSTRFCGYVGLSVLVGAHRRALAEGGGIGLVVPADGPVVRSLDLTGAGTSAHTVQSRHGRPWVTRTCQFPFRESHGQFQPRGK